MVKVKRRLLFAWLAKLMTTKLLNNISGDVPNNILYLVFIILTEPQFHILSYCSVTIQKAEPMQLL